MNNYYDPNIKRSEIKYLRAMRILFINCDILDNTSLTKIFTDCNPDKVVNLAAQAGVRYSIKNPQIYMEVNVLVLNM